MGNWLGSKFLLCIAIISGPAFGEGAFAGPARFHASQVNTDTAPAVSTPQQNNQINQGSGDQRRGAVTAAITGIYQDQASHYGVQAGVSGPRWGSVLATEIPNNLDGTGLIREFWRVNASSGRWEQVTDPNQQSQAGVSLWLRDTQNPNSWLHVRFSNNSIEMPLAGTTYDGLRQAQQNFFGMHSQQRQAPNTDNPQPSLSPASPPILMPQAVSGDFAPVF